MKIILFLLGFFLLSISLFAQSPTTIPDKPELVFVDGGTFKPGFDQKRTAILSDFYISKYEITVSQYRAFCEDLGRAMPEEPEWGWNDRHPIVNVSYDDALAYCFWLSEKFGGKWRLPTEVEWEFAARGGNKYRWNPFSGDEILDFVGWYDKNSGGQVHEVGTKMPNELGIHDMSGNVFEWCSDWFGAFYPTNPVLDYTKTYSDPQGPPSGKGRVVRGGSFFQNAWFARVLQRMEMGIVPSTRYAEIGFRVVLSQ